jgi:hypothetical protein
MIQLKMNMKMLEENYYQAMLFFLKYKNVNLKKYQKVSGEDLGPMLEKIFL